MALADRISPGSRHKITNASKVSSISASFAEGKHVDLQDFPGEAALLYQIQKMEEDIDELRRYITNEATGSAVKSIKEVNVDEQVWDGAEGLERTLSSPPPYHSFEEPPKVE